jgi:hypothetical protein
VLFEIVAFSQVMGSLRLATTITIGLYRFGPLILNLPSLVLRLLLAILSAVLGKIPWRAIKAVPGSHFSEAVRTATEEAQAFPLVQALRWLEEHPVSSRGLRAINFCLVVVFAGVELFTS